ncbi:MAG TPA: hypothetical protein DD672_09860 [Gammaproteobacteria bacterium]|nr:hypothetical protein [Gammaproteobacteria bacterium]HCA35629.1 hypothetical protein [Gammaproteobacteria bacterium]
MYSREAAGPVYPFTELWFRAGIFIFIFLNWAVSHSMLYFSCSSGSALIGPAVRFCSSGPEINRPRDIATAQESAG